jgi:hypothetical protein
MVCKYTNPFILEHGNVHFHTMGARYDRLGLKTRKNQQQSHYQHRRPEFGNDNHLSNIRKKST